MTTTLELQGGNTLPEIWHVPAVIWRVIDGDTLDVTLDLGWKIFKRDSVRLAGINAPEMRDLEGHASKSYLEMLLPVGTPIHVHSHKLDKYGRCLATVTRDSDNLDCCQEMISSGHAVPYLV